MGNDLAGNLSEQGRCFVMQPFDGDKFDNRFVDVFGPAIKAAGLEPYRVDRDPGVVIPIDDIEKGIREAEACFAEITTDNPNVWFELGCAVALGKPVCLVCSSERTTPFPFDVRHRTILKYNVGSVSDFRTLEKKIAERLVALLQRQRSLDSLPTLTPTGKTHGLTPPEVAILALLIAQFDADGLTAYELKKEMRRAGYTEIATGLAIEQLKRSKFIQQVTMRDEHGDAYFGWGLASGGTDWLLQNQDQLNLHEKPNDDDIPF